MTGGDERRLWEAEQRFRLAFDNAPIGMALVSVDGRFLEVNQALCDIVGHPAGELLMKSFQDITVPGDLEADLGSVRRMLAGEIRTYSMDKRYFHAAGHEVRIRLSVSLVRDEDDEPRYFIRQIEEITDRNRAEAALRQSEQRFRRLIETSTEAFIAIDAGGVITEWNRQAEATFGWSRSEAVGRRLEETIIPPALRESHAAGLARYHTTGAAPVLGRRLELEGRHRDGREFPVEVTVWAVGAGDDVSFNALLHDISERRRTEQQLWELALVDDLTGLHNRRSFMLLAEQAMKEAARAGRPVIALFVDLDHLKDINDRHGHSEGDRALRFVAGALRAACRESDIVGRLSGDEFAILLAEAHGRDGLEGRVRARVAEAAATSGLPLSVSIGTATAAPGERPELSELFERADQAMYEEKAAKRRNEPRRSG